MEVSQQVAIARQVARKQRDVITAEDLLDACVANGLSRPSAAFARAVLSKVRGVSPPRTLLDVLLDYRRFAIRSLSHQFGGNTKGREDELRNNLLTFLPPR